MRKSVNPLVILIFLKIGLFGQSSERGNPNYRRLTEIDVNKVRASIHNFGSSGNSGVAGSFFYEWPTNSAVSYTHLTLPTIYSV